MDKLKSTRKNFRCVFNNYVTEFNKDSIIQSVISQFQGYFADPEVTLHDEGFIITLTLGDSLSATMARDKILWNSFIESVTAQDIIRKIQILRLPKAGLMDFGERVTGAGSVGGFGPEVDPMTGDTGVNEKLNNPRTTKPPKYQIDGEPDDPLGHFASIRLADPTDLPSEDQTFVQGLTPEGLDSKSTVLQDEPGDSLESGKRQVPRVFNAGFKRLSFESDMAGSFTLTQPNGFQSVNDSPRDGGLHEEAGAATGIGGGAPISGASWYVTQPGNEQGTDLGTERNRGDASSAPFGNISASNTTKAEEYSSDELDPTHNIRGEYGSTLDVLGVGDDPIGGASYGSLYFGLNEFYDYEGDVDDYDI